MSSIVLPVNFTVSDLPLDQDLKTLLAANAHLKWWGQADPEHLVQSAGAVSQWNSVTGGAVTYVQATAANQAVLAAQAGIGGYDGAVFDGVNDRYTPSVAPLDLSTTFSLAVLFKLAADAAGTSRAVVHAYNAAAQQTGLYVSSVLALQAWATGKSITLSSALSVDAWHLAIVSLSGGNVRAALDGGAPSTAAVTTGTVPTNALIIGALNTSAYFKGAMSDVMMWDIDLLAAGNEATLAQVYEYFAGTYGLTLG